MRQKNLKTAIVILSFLFVISPLATIYSSVGANVKLVSDEKEIKSHGEFGDKKSTRYTTHAPVRINGDENFTTVNGVSNPGAQGTEADPYIIEGWDINGSELGYCLGIWDTTAHFIVRQCNLHDTVTKGSSHYFGSGIILYNAGNGTITDNICSDNEWDGIFLSSSSNNRIENNTCKDNKGAGIWIFTGSTDNIIRSNYCSSNSKGIYIGDSDGNMIKDNTLNDSIRSGIHIKDAINTLYSNKMDSGGIYLQTGKVTYTSQLIPTNNTVRGKPIYFYGNIDMNNASIPTGAGQVILGNVTNLRIENLEIDSVCFGIDISYSKSIYLENNSCIGNFWNGINLYHSSDISVLNNNCSSNYRGIYTDYSSESITVSDNTCFGNGDSGILSRSQNSIVSRNTCLFNNYGIRISASHQLVENNTCSYNDKYGISVETRDNKIQYNDCFNNNFSGIRISQGQNEIYKNKMRETGISIDGDLATLSTLSISTNNTLNGKVIYFHKNKDMKNISIPLDAAQVLLVNITHIQISNLGIANCGYGIQIYYSRGIKIDNNSFNGNGYYGIFLYHSNDNIIENNTCRESSHSGIGVFSSSDNLIQNNSCYTNSVHGIYLSSSSDDNMIKNNNCSNNKESGIHISSDYNTIKDNICSNNKESGISSNGIYNKIYKNRLVSCGISISGDEESLSTHEIPNTNTVNKKPIYYYKNTNMDNQSVPHSAGQVILVNVSWLNIENLYINDSNKGISIYSSSHITITDNEISHIREHGIYLQSSNSNIVEGNMLLHNDIAVYISHSDDNQISNNTCNSNNYGIHLRSTDDNILIYNNLVNNINQGLILHLFTHDNIVHHNNFFANNAGGIQASDNGTGSQWNSTDGEGNYWGDYGERYPNATNNGTIWDKPYEINGSAGAKDYYPLVAPYDSIPPTADGGNNRTVDEDTSVTLDASNSTDNKGIANYTWTFVDKGEQTLYGKNPIYIFDTPGIYNITLIVTDTTGNWDAHLIEITVRDITDPVAEAGDDVVIVQHESLSFDGTGSIDNVGVVNWTWEFDYKGETVTLYDSTPSFTFDKVGTYEVELTVRDEAGNEVADILNLTVTDTTSPVADAGDDQSVELGENFTLDASSSTDNTGIVNYTWNIEGDEYYGPQVTYSFSAPGTYNLTLVVRDEAGNTHSDAITITVEGQDTDGDGIPDSVDSDRDGDGHPNDDDEYPDDPERWKSEEGDDGYLVVAVGAALIAVFLFGVYFMYRKKRRGEEMGENGEKEPGEDGEEEEVGKT